MIPRDLKNIAPGPELILCTLEKQLDAPAQIRLFGGVAIEKTNEILADTGLYIGHIFGPEEQIVAPNWLGRCKSIVGSWGPKLQVQVLGPMDLIITKMCRGDDADFADIQFLLDTQNISSSDLLTLISQAQVPPIFDTFFNSAKSRLNQIIKE